MKRLELLQISLQDLYFFITIVDKKTMTAAAEQLHVTQPLLSRCVSKLETILGITLFIRARHNLILTEAGKLLYDYAKEQLEDFEKVNEKAKSLHQAVKKRYTFGVSEGINPTKRQQIALQLKLLFPECDFDIVVLPYVQIPGKLASCQLDMAIIPDYENIRESMGINGVPINKLCIAITVPMSSPLYEKKKLSWKDLEGQAILIPDSKPSKGYGLLLAEKTEALGFSPKYEYLKNFDDATLASASGKGILISLGNAVFISSTSFKTFYMKDAPVDIMLAYSDPNLISENFAHDISMAMAPLFPSHTEK